jgi:hypothetical protein
MADVVYTTRTPHPVGSSSVLVVACTGYDNQAPVREFLDQQLKLPEGSYNLLAVPGGPHFLLLSEYLPKFGWVGQRWLRFAVDKLGVTRVILIGHQGCTWSADERFIPALLHKLGHGEQSPDDRQRGELKEAASYLRSFLPQVAFEAYFMTASEDGLRHFSKQA